jgi:hypothetical protein
MKLRYWNVAAVTFILTTLVSWAAVSGARQTPQGEPVGQLTMATACTASAYHVAPGDSATMTVINDGGWCWADSSERDYWRSFSASYVTVTNPPKHGHVLVGDLANQNVRVAYQPEPGFTGQDSFNVHYRGNEHDLTFLVSVSRPLPVVAYRHSM